MRNIKVKYNERGIVPNEILRGVDFSVTPRGGLESSVVETADGVRCLVSLRGVGDLSNAAVKAEYSSVCGKLYGMGFDRVEGAWISRLGKLTGYWALIEMRKA